MDGSRDRGPWFCLRFHSLNLLALSRHLARKELQAHLASFNDLLKTDVAAFNRLALDKGANTLFAGNPIELKERVGQGGK